MIRVQDVVVFQGSGDERSALGPSISYPVSFIFGKSKRQVGGIGGQRVFGRQDVDASVLPFHKIHDPGPVVRRKSVTFAAMDIANARSNGRGVVERIVESFDQQLSRRHARHQQEVERWRNANY